MKTIGTCKECKFWDNIRPPHNGVCKHPKNDRDFDHQDSANPRCSRQLATRIFPGPDFGCIHFDGIKPPLMTIDEYPKYVRERSIQRHKENVKAFSKTTEPTPSSIKCPDCEREMMFNHSVYAWGPFHDGVQCDCGLKGMIDSMNGYFTRMEETK